MIIPVPSIKRCRRLGRMLPDIASTIAVGFTSRSWLRLMFCYQDWNFPPAVVSLRSDDRCRITGREAAICASSR